jgi:hypothetical protein
LYNVSQRPVAFSTQPHPDQHFRNVMAVDFSHAKKAQHAFIVGSYAVVSVKTAQFFINVYMQKTNSTSCCKAMPFVRRDKIPLSGSLTNTDNYSLNPFSSRAFSYLMLQRFA